jgi:hypothetical protein
MRKNQTPFTEFGFTLRGTGDAIGSKMQYRRISADCHLDLPWLPAGLFVENASRELRDRMPYVREGPDGPYWVTKASIWASSAAPARSPASLCPGRARNGSRPPCSLGKRRKDEPDVL